MQVKNILIVDDDSEDSEFFITVAGQIDPHLQVTAAVSREEMFHYLEQSVPDLLFIDSFIQHDSGLLAIQEIRKRLSFGYLPIIMYTGSADVKNIAHAFKAGASAYIVKPHSLAEIKTVLQKVLDKNWKEEGATIQKQYYMDGQFHEFKE